MKTSEAIRRAGGTQQKLADLLGITRSAISQWGPDMPELSRFRLKELRPHWFRKPRAQKGTSGEQHVIG